MERWRMRWLEVGLLIGWVIPAFAGEGTISPMEPRIMPPALSWPNIVSSIVYGLLGLILLLIAYYVYEIITPFSVKEELTTHRNMAVGIVVAAFILGMAIVIAAAII